MPSRSHEPLIVTALRQYVRRRAPASLLHRIAGGVEAWRYLNAIWVIDPKDLPPATSRPKADGAVSSVLPIANLLSQYERRQLLEQVVIEGHRGGVTLPVTKQLAYFLGVDESTIRHDLAVIRTQPASVL